MNEHMKPKRGDDAPENQREAVEDLVEEFKELLSEDELVETGEPETAPEAADDGTDWKAEAATLKDKLLRVMAEAENVRRRAARDKDDAARFGASKFARDILVVADNLERALAAQPDEPPEGVKDLVAGVELTERELQKVLTRHGVTRIDPLGERFNPNIHEAMFEAPIPGHVPGTVFQVIEAGYAMGERLLRPARVGVARAAPEASAPKPEPEPEPAETARTDDKDAANEA